MIETIYIEKEVQQHPRVLLILERFSQARVIYIERYSEIFNRKAQNFRLQKQQPALILARKHKNYVLPAPAGYSVGGQHHYYFSHMMNCLYDCRYCFLQGMYRSAHFVVFINYEDFNEAIEQVCLQHSGEESWFFSGYDCDSLALEPITGFVEHTLELFSKYDHIYLELRTKSTQIRNLLQRPPMNNVVVAFSLSPEHIATSLEAKTPPIEKRLDAMKKLQQKGWKIGLRFDPLIYHENYKQSYQQLFQWVFSFLDVKQLHSVSLGGFRMPAPFFNHIIHLYPYEPLFAGKMETHNGMVAYAKEQECAMMTFCSEELLRYIPDRLFFPCISS